MTTIATFLGLLQNRECNTVRQQLREFTYNSEAKQGKKRKTVEVEGCFVWLLRWVLSLWTSEAEQMALAIDATTFKLIFTVLSVSILYRGCSIPIAWHVLPAGKAEAWRPHWERLLSLIAADMPSDWQVMVLADRGLYAKWLYQHIIKLGWHPFLRINQQGNYRPEHQTEFRPLKGLVNASRPTWSGPVTCFSTCASQLSCTLLAYFDPAYKDPWLVVTDLPPTEADIACYGMRAWIECGFKDFKRGGWQWHQTKMTDPERASRLWLVMAVATIWVLSIGGEAEATDAVFPETELTLNSLPDPAIVPCQPRASSRPRLISVFARGLLTILVALLKGIPTLIGEFIPQPWPSSLSQPILRQNTYP
jgi:hypothetical protein